MQKLKKQKLLCMVGKFCICWALLRVSYPHCCCCCTSCKDAQRETGCSTRPFARSRAWAEFLFPRKQISQAVVEPRGNLVTSVLQPQSVLCSGHLGQPRSPSFVCAAFATTPSPAGAAQGLWVWCEGTGLGGAGCMSATRICSGAITMGRLKSGHISLSFCYSRVNLKKFA